MELVSTLGAIVALAVAIGLILKKVSPTYGMVAGALIGGLVGGADLVYTVELMMGGAKNIIPAVLRILAAGVLAGVLIESGGAARIADTIVGKLGEVRALLALAVATMILTSVGVFVDVAVITVAPIALLIAERANISRFAVLLAMIGGGKAGNVMSPNPNTIAAADAFHQSLTSVMMGGVIPGLVGLFVAYLLARRLSNFGSAVHASEVHDKDHNKVLPSFGAAIVAPSVAIGLLALRPLFDIKVDPLIALPVGGIAGTLAMGKIRQLNHYSTAGLQRMLPVAVMLLGTGTLAGIVANSELNNVLIDGIANLGLPAYVLAPVAGILMSMATASTTAGTAVASQVFAATLTTLGVAPLGSAVMIHSGATVLDSLPHGSFFHATAGAVGMQMKERLKMIPYEAAIGMGITVTATLIYGVFNLG
ncbi:GntP family permease [Deefgea piscis]|uniref:GntP family permease n=1 Tax=Deefgea piscis TaxID=2739061 RepID=A0A6M8SR59_9NEIS|nr:GntP family permease [Deefgea piscis]QKJ65786.1 GntP family permease [Deefgea piscis]